MFSLGFLDRLSIQKGRTALEVFALFGPESMILDSDRSAIDRRENHETQGDELS
jgi:hypothetical protein